MTSVEAAALTEPLCRCGHAKVQHRNNYRSCAGCSEDCQRFDPRVPVNDEAEALRTERDAYRDQSDEDQKRRGQVVMELDALRDGIRSLADSGDRMHGTVRTSQLRELLEDNA